MSVLIHDTSNIADSHLVNEKKFYLGQYSVVLLPVQGLVRFLGENSDTTYQLRVRLSHFSAYEHSEMAHIIR